MSFSIGSFFSEVEKAGMKIGDFIAHALKLGKAVQQMWSQCGPQTMIVASQVVYDVVKSAMLAEQAAQAAGGGSWLGAVQLSEQTISSVQQLVTDFKAGEKQVVLDFQTLKYDFSVPQA
jgi:hypothetical protein